MPTLTTLTNLQRADAEQAIRDLAVIVTTGAQNRKNHPTYGYTKTKIRKAAHEMEGAIALYGLLTGQKQFINATTVVKFDHGQTTHRVTAARMAVKSLGRKEE